MLIAGKENLEKIKILISLTNIKSPEIKSAIIGYYCLGICKKTDKSNWNRAMNRIQEVDNLIQRFKELENE